MKYGYLFAFVLYLNGVQSGSYDYADVCMVHAVNWVFSKNAVYHEGIALGEKADGRSAFCVNTENGQTYVSY